MVLLVLRRTLGCFVSRSWVSPPPTGFCGCRRQNTPLAGILVFQDHSSVHEGWLVFGKMSNLEPMESKSALPAPQKSLLLLFLWSGFCFFVVVVLPSEDTTRV